MGRTIASYRQRIEIEEEKKWGGFRKSLRPKYQQSWEQLWLYAREFGDAASNALGPVISDTIFISMLLGIQERLDKLEKILNELTQEKNSKSPPRYLEEKKAKITSAP